MAIAYAFLSACSGGRFYSSSFTKKSVISEHRCFQQNENLQLSKKTYSFKLMLQLNISGYSSDFLDDQFISFLNCSISISTAQLSHSGHHLLVLQSFKLYQISTCKQPTCFGHWFECHVIAIAI